MLGVSAGYANKHVDILWNRIYRLLLWFDDILAIERRSLCLELTFNRYIALNPLLAVWLF